MRVGELDAEIDLDADGFDQGLDDAESSFEKTAGRLSALAATAAVGIGAALAGGIAGAMELGEATSKMNAQIGASGEFAAEMGANAGAVYAAGFGENMAEVGDAMARVWQQGLVAEDAGDEAIQKTTEKVLNLSKAFDQDLEKSTGAVSTMLKTGLAKNADEAMDVLTRGMQQGVNKSDDLLDTFIEYPTIFRSLGLSATQATGLLSQGLRAGARDADTVADSLKEFQIRATDGSTASAEGFKALGLNAEKMTAQIAKGGPEASAGLQTVLERLRAMQDPVAKNAAAVALFGTKSEDMAKALNGLDLSKAEMELGDVAGAADKMGETLNDNAGAKIETFKRQMQMGLVDLVGNKAIPAIEGLINTVGPMLGPAFDRAGAAAATAGNALKATAGFISDHQVPIGIVAALITAVFVPAWIAAGVAATTSAARQTAAWIATKAQAIAGTAAQSGALIATGARWAWAGTQSLLHAGRMAAAWFIALGPIGWVTAAVIAIVALIIANWDAVWSKTKEIWSWFSDKIVGAASAVKDWLASNWPLLLAILTGPIGLAVLAIIKNWDKITSGASSMYHAVVDFFTSLPGKILGAFAGAGRWLWDIGVDIVRGLAGGIESMAGWLLSKAKDVVMAPVNAAKKWLHIGSPSKLWADEIGKQIPAGMAIGIESGMGEVARTATTLAQSAAPSLTLGNAALTSMPAASAGFSGSGSPTNVYFTGPVYADSAGINRLAGQLTPMLQRGARGYADANGGRAGYA